MKLISRAEWGARAPTSPFQPMDMPSPRLWIHHSADSRQGAAAVRDHQRYHQDVRGWKDIAYNFLIGSDGSIFEGRGAGIAGGATAGDNTRSHAICLLGNFEVERPTGSAWASLVDLVRHGRDAGWWVPTCGGHRDAPGAATACPGRHLYARLPQLRREITTPLDREEPEMMIVQSKKNGAAILITGNAAVLIVNSAELIAHKAAGVPHVGVSHDQFTRYEPLRLNGDRSNAARSALAAAIGSATGAAVIKALPPGTEGGLTIEQVGEAAEAAAEVAVRRVFADAAD